MKLRGDSKLQGNPWEIGGDPLFGEHAPWVPIAAFEDPPEVETGEKKLAAAILQSAIDDLDSPQDRGRALHWFFFPDPRHVYNFQAICDVLELDAPSVRKFYVKLEHRGTPGS